MKKINKIHYLKTFTVYIAANLPHPLKTTDHTEKKINILAISGSLRPNSSNDAVIKTAATLVAGKAGFIIYDGLGSLPHFNDSQDPAPEVIAFRKLLAQADGLFICSPEYAFGVPGVLKNALDWTVSSGELVNKPVAVITAATSGDKAHASLLLTLTALSAHVLDECTLLIPFIRSKIDTEGNVKDSETIEAINHIMDTFINDIRN